MRLVEDTDFTLHHGDVREILPTLDAGSVDCVVTSPPYWGLRDYGTGSWEGGDPDCDHMHGKSGGEMLGAGQKLQAWRDAHPSQTLGWSDCGHGDYRPGVVLDPFLGSGTTALVAREQNRRCVGIELSAEYAALAARRLQQLSLLA